MRLLIQNLGPVSKCDIDLYDFNVITGKQSSGKSTIAKSLYFFLLVKDVLGRISFKWHRAGISEAGRVESLNAVFKNHLKNIFVGVFGMDCFAHKGEALVRMDYSEDIFVKITNKNGISVSYSNRLKDFIKHLQDRNTESLEENYFDSLQREINDFFRFDYTPVYIPAGRSLMTVIGSQFELFYSTLDDRNKDLIDLCSRRFFETVMRIKPLLSNGVDGLRGKKRADVIIDYCQTLMKDVLNGQYRNNHGKEYLQMDDGQQISINMASSGQQAALWIYNILTYYSVYSIKKFYIIEEPESNLFPESQQIITKFLGLIHNLGNSMLINTHSPYVLGEINNLIYAGSITKKVKERNEVIPKEYQLSFDEVRAFFVENGLVNDCMDSEIKQIDNSKLDAISDVINREYDRLLEIEEG